MKVVIAMVMAMSLYAQTCEQVMYVDAYTGEIKTTLICSD